MRAIGYARVSTGRQATEGVSLEAQKDRIAAWCQASGYELVGIYVDAGRSGRSARNRPQLKAALEAVGQDVALVAYSLSRLARSTRDTLAIAERIENVGADLVTLAEKIDTTTAAGRLFFRIAAAFSEFESDMIGERVAEAWRTKRQRGEKTGGACPYGYTAGPDGVLVESEKEQRVVGLVAELRRQGWTYRAILTELQSGETRPRSGGKWHLTQITRIVKRAVA